MVRLTVEDALGNTSFDELTFTWDTSAVSVSVGPDIFLNASTPLSPTVSGEGAGATYEWSATGPGIVTFSPNANSKDLTGITANVQGSYTVTLTATNNTTTLSGSDSLVLVWDTIAPSVDSFTKINDITDDFLNASERGMSNPLVALSASNEDTIEFTITSGASCAAATAYSEAVPLSNDIRISADGAYKVCVKLTDNAGNLPAYGELPFTADTALPSSNSIAINGGGDYDTDGLVDLTLASTDANSIQMKVSNASDCSTGSYEAYSTSKLGWPLAQLNGTAIVYVKFRDAAGNESACISDSITHDDQAPSDPAISIAGGSAYTTSTSVTLSLAAVGASTMLITNNSDCTTGGVEESFASTKSWTLGQTNSTTTVYVRYRDTAGNWSSCVSDTIVHDNLVPSLAITSTGWINSTNVSNYEVSGTCNENGRAVILGGSASGSGVCDGTNFTAYLNYAGVADGSASVSITADMSDVAGNSANQATATLDKDTVAPQLTISNTGWVGSSNQSAYTISGTCTDATSGVDTRTVNISGTASNTATCVGGNFSANLDYSSAGNGLAAISVLADISDLAGNSAIQLSLSLGKDVVAPTLAALNDIAINASYTYDATTSSSLSGVQSYTWSQISGPGLVTFGAESSEDTSMIADTEGVYRIQLRVVDEAGNLVQDTMDLTWDTTQPSITALSNQTVRTTYSYDSTVMDTLSGMDTYAWSQRSGPGTISFSSASSEDTDITADTDGSYVIRFTGTDIATNSAYDELTFIWDTTPPMITALVDQVVGVPPFTYDATVVDATTSVSSYAWSQVSGPGILTFGSSSSEDTTIFSDEDGVYVVRLTVADILGNSTSDDMNFEWDIRPNPGNSGNMSSSSTYYDRTSISWTKATDLVTAQSDLVYHVYYSSSSSMDTVLEAEAGTAVATNQTDIDSLDITGLEPEQFTILT